ncbi:MAG: hypothetical protein ABI851_15990 [Saprospiraceae bacterium]
MSAILEKHRIQRNRHFDLEDIVIGEHYYTILIHSVTGKIIQVLRCHVSEDEYAPQYKFEDDVWKELNVLAQNEFKRINTKSAIKFAFFDILGQALKPNF